MATGWGRLTWGQSDWGDTNVYATGWSAKSWGDSNWEISPMKQFPLPVYQQQLP